nr:hypothetical protein [Tanacetum cinerariifolium]
MTSFNYRLNPRYAIKECPSCGTLYTRDCSCSKGSVEDKILVPKPPKNYARCAKCGHTVNGPYCQGCALLREKLEILACCDDDDDYNFSITPVLSTEEPVDSLSMGDKHLDTIPTTESDEVIKSSVEDLIPIPSESEGIPEHKCDVPFHDNSLPLDVSKDQIEDLSDSNEEFSSINDDSFSIDNIDYVEASPPDSE